MVLYTEEQLQQAYIKFLLDLHDLEKEGMDMGKYPTIEEFRLIFEEEYEANNP
jgi:hypothetical protein